MPASPVLIHETPWPRWLPRAKRVLAVVAHPGEESACLGGVLRLYRDAGARIAVLCLTRGEVCSANVSTCGDRDAHVPEFGYATAMLGAEATVLADQPDGRLDTVPVADLAERIRRFATDFGAGLLLVVDGAAAAGNPDVAAVAHAARQAHADSTAAGAGGLPVLAWTLPQDLDIRPPGHRRRWTGRRRERIDIVLDVPGDDRRTQLAALRAYHSWGAPDLLRHEARLRLQGAREWLRWLSR